MDKKMDEVELKENAKTSTEDLVEEEEEPSALVKCLTSRPVELAFFWGITFYGFFTVLSDWLVLRDVLNGKEGLVFGPPHIGITVALVIVTVFGMIAYVVEMANMIRETFFRVETVDEDALQVVGLYVQEVPQITINMYLAACREAAVSVFQLVKAVLGIIGGFIRVAVLLSHFFTKKKKDKTHWVERILVLAGALYVFAGSLTVFSFIYTVPPGEGTGFRLPTNLLKSTLDDGKYLYNTSVYFSHPNFASCNNNNKPWNERSINWFKVASVYKIKQGQTFMIYDLAPNNNAFIYIRESFPLETFCYRTEQRNCQITKISCPSPLPITNVNTLYLHFRFREHSQVMPLGDIRFNARQYANRTCNVVYNQKPGYIATEGWEKLGQFHYLRSDNDPEENFGQAQGGQLRYLIIDQDMKNVSEVWRTGYTKCEMSGSLSPNHDNKVPIDCTLTSFYKHFFPAHSVHRYNLPNF